MSRSSAVMGVQFVSVCFALLLPLALCNTLPAISSISKEEIKEIGQEVAFNCTVQHNADQKYSVLWNKLGKDRAGNTVTLTLNEKLVLPDERFSVTIDPATSTYTLKIKELQESDTGFYQCLIQISVNDRVTAQVELQIRRPPTITVNTTTHSVNVTEGKPFELQCNADGFPVPSITWNRENDLLLSTGGAIHRGNILRIPSAYREDRGVYFCTAENGVGQTATANATVRVEFAPVITAVRPRVGQAPGYEVNLECRIEAYPAPTVTWWKNGAELKRDELKSQEDEFITSLNRYSVSSSDFGEYVCRAQNKHGVAETKVELFETIIPVCATPCG